MSRRGRSCRRPDSRSRASDAVRALQTIGEFTAGKKAADFLGDAMLRAAVERLFTIAGEALSQLRRLGPDFAGRVAGLTEAVALRNVLVHGYALVNADVIWLTVTDDVPSLRASLRALLDAER